MSHLFQCQSVTLKRTSCIIPVLGLYNERILFYNAKLIWID